MPSPRCARQSRLRVSCPLLVRWSPASSPRHISVSRASPRNGHRALKPPPRTQPARRVPSEAAERADFRSLLRYGQCWEDADILVDGLGVGAGHTCLSIASAGENTLSLLSRGAARVVAIDLNPAQLAALELRV